MSEKTKALQKIIARMQAGKKKKKKQYCSTTVTLTTDYIN
jgi:hypothetical protein